MQKISLTQSAAEHIQRSLEGRGKGLGIRIGVKTTGCSGMAYVLEFVDTPDDDDIVFSEHGVSVYVDPKSMVYIAGTVVDFVKEGLQEGILFSNPNIAGECGCGESFTV